MFKFLGPVLSLAILAGACGDAEASDDGLVIEGTIYSDHLVDMDCDALDSDGAIRTGMTGITVVIAASDGSMLDSVATDDFQAEKIDAGCRYSVTFTATIEDRPAYTFDFRPHDPPSSGVYFDGIGDLGRVRLDHAELAATGFQPRFEAPPTFVVP